MHLAEFAIGDKVEYWSGKEFINATVTKLTLNPISNIIEYRLFYIGGKNGGKRSRNFKTVTPIVIKESKYFKEK